MEAEIAQCSSSVVVVSSTLHLHRFASCSSMHGTLVADSTQICCAFCCAELSSPNSRSLSVPVMAIASSGVQASEGSWAAWRADCARVRTDRNELGRFRDFDLLEDDERPLEARVAVSATTLLNAGGIVAVEGIAFGVTRR